MTEKRKKLVFGIVFSFLFCFLCVGYAQINDELFINGSVKAGTQDDVFIYEVLKKDANGNWVIADDVSYVGTTLTTTVTEAVTYQVKFINKNSDFDFYYNKLITDETGTITGNSKIKETVSGMHQYDYIYRADSVAGNTIECEITLNHSASEKLTSIAEFQFSKYSSVFSNSWYSYLESSVSKDKIVNISIVAAKEDDVTINGNTISYTDIDGKTVNNLTADMVFNLSDNEKDNLPIAYLTKNGSYYDLTILGGDTVGNIFVNNMELMFEKFANLKSITGLDNLNTMNAKSMLGAFRYNPSLTSIDLRGLDTSNMEDMRVIFDGCSALEWVNISTLDTSSATRFNGFFQNCTNLTQTQDENGNLQGKVDLSHFDTRNVESFYCMFQLCTNLRYVDFYGENTYFNEISTLDNDSMYMGMIAMFQHCPNLEIVDIRGFDTSIISKMQCDVQGTDTNGMQNMFNSDTTKYPFKYKATIYTHKNWTIKNVKTVFNNRTSSYYVTTSTGEPTWS